ncbi:MAG TPA: MarR family transcriptional regulator [Sporosarcina sp.]|nr:MarR family transcriptional regulator [Sporosarcina sp.]
MEDKERALKLFIVLSRATKVISEESNKIIEQFGLNPTEFGVLELLHHRGRQPIQKIGQKILLRSGSMTYVVNRLEEKGYLQRIFCEEDKRITYIEITDAGVSLVEEIFPDHVKKIESLMSGLSKEEQEQTIELVKKLGLSVKDLSN